MTVISPSAALLGRFFIDFGNFCLQVNTVILVTVVREIFKIQTSGVSHSTKFDLVK